jgi:hypothetical protein
MPTVTMNDGTAQRTVTKPLIRPAARPIDRHTTTASSTGRCQSTSAIASTAEPSASTEPTDRSMPPAISTSVNPTAITVSAGIWLASVVNVSRVRK